MIKAGLVSAAMLAAAGGASAQVSLANPPGGTLAPATGTIGTAPLTPAPTPAGDLPPGKTKAQIAAEKYKTEIVCKTSIQTGSLIATHKQCLTRAQWRYVEDANEAEARRLMLENTTRSGCGGPSC